MFVTDGRTHQSEQHIARVEQLEPLNRLERPCSTEQRIAVEQGRE